MKLLLFVSLILTTYGQIVTFLSSPPSAIRISDILSYQVVTDPVTSSLTVTTAPAGAAFQGRTLTWTPSQGGAFSFIITATSGANSVDQAFTLNVDDSIVRVRCGATTSAIDSRGFTWGGDAQFSTNTASRTFTTTTNIGATTDPFLFQLERWDPAVDLSYSFPLQDGDYRVELGWAEAFTGTQVVGGRLFDVVLEGVVVARAFDIFANAGAFNAVTRTFTVTSTGGALTVVIRRGVQNPKLNNIVITPIRPPTPPPGSPLAITSTVPNAIAVVGRAWQYTLTVTGTGPFTFSLVTPPTGASISSLGVITYTPVLADIGKTVTFTVRVANANNAVTQLVSVTIDSALIRLNCGGPTLVDSNRLTWTSDAGLSNSARVFTNTGATVTTILQTHRWLDGNLAYAIPLANGNYKVDLLWAEIFTRITSPGLRIFDVTVENAPPTTGLDVFAQSGGLFRPLTLSFIITITDGTLHINFLRRLENPFLAALVITPTTAPNPPPPNPNCNTAAGFVVDSAGRCVFPTTPGICPRNRVDCSLGCVDPNDNIANNICRGGTCVNGVCVRTTLNTARRTRAENIIRAFITDRINGNPGRGIPRERFVGDFLGQIVRGAFHSVSNKRAQACLLVTECGSQRCEFNADHNFGLEFLVTTIKDLYDSNNLWIDITLQDFFYLATVVAVNVASGGTITIPFRWGHSACQCLDFSPAAGQTCANLPFFPGTMPEPEVDFSVTVNTMEVQFGFTRREWFCLLGAHAIGRADPDASGYARSWTNTPNLLDNSYYTIMADETLIWDREGNVNGQTPTTVSDLSQPVVGLRQLQVRGQGRAGPMMLHADMNMFWDCDANAKQCAVTHTGAGCPQRLSTHPSFAAGQTAFDVLQLFRNNAGAWRTCFAGAYQKMIEIGETGLQNVAP